MRQQRTGIAVGLLTFFSWLPWLAFPLPIISLLAIPAQAQQASYPQTSLRFIPDDAAFYVSNMQIGRQWLALANSNAVKRLMESPFVQMGMGQAKEMWRGYTEEDAWQEFWSEPANEELVSMLWDAVSNEVFFYANEDFVKFTKEYASFAKQINKVQLRMLQNGEALDEEDLFDDVFLNAISRVPNLIPSMTAGFKVSDPDVAKRQLERLHDLIQVGLEEEGMETLKSQYEKVQTDDSLLLTVKFDGETFPFEESGFLEQIEEEVPSEQQTRVLNMLKELKVALSVGVFEDYVLIGIGKDLASRQFENPKKLLIDRKEFKGLKQEGVDLVSVSYSSHELRTSVSAEDQLGTLAQLFMAGFKQGFTQAIDVELSEGLLDEMEDDLDMFADDLIDWIPKPGAYLRYTYLTERGYEGKVYDWGTNYYDGSAPLKLTKHLGGQPIGFSVSRTKPTDAGPSLRHYAGRVDYYVEKLFGGENDNPQTQVGYDNYKKVRPLIVKLGDVVYDKLRPSFGGESMLVVDAQASAKQWHNDMPPSDTELPMLEMAMVMEVEDVKQLRSACQDIYSVANEYFAMARKENPDAEFPEELPPPTTYDLDGATMFGYAFPDEMELDPDFAMPNAVLSEDTLVLSFMPSTSKRLIKDVSSQHDGVLAKLDQPLMAASQFRWTGLVDAVLPWVEYAARLQEDENTEMIVGQSKFAADILKCFRGYSSVVYEQDAATVTHFEWQFEDLP